MYHNLWSCVRRCGTQGACAHLMKRRGAARSESLVYVLNNNPVLFMMLQIRCVKSIMMCFYEPIKVLIVYWGCEHCVCVCVCDKAEDWWMIRWSDNDTPQTEFHCFPLHSPHFDQPSLPCTWLFTCRAAAALEWCKEQEVHTTQFHTLSMKGGQNLQVRTAKLLMPEALTVQGSLSAFMKA